MAAINGHAYAGGFITAIDCDYRIAADGELQFALNEVPIGIPMPAVYCEIIKYAIGTQAASEFTLFGQVYDLEAASRMGVVQKTVEADQLLDAAVAWAAHVTPDCYPALPFPSALCRQRRWPRSIQPRNSIWIGCREVCRIPESARECTSLPGAEGPRHYMGSAGIRQGTGAPV